MARLRRLHHLRRYLEESIGNMTNDPIIQQMNQHKLSATFAGRRILEIFAGMVDAEREQYIMEILLRMESQGKGIRSTANNGNHNYAELPKIRDDLRDIKKLLESAKGGITAMTDSFKLMRDSATMAFQRRGPSTEEESLGLQLIALRKKTRRLRRGVAEFAAFTDEISKAYKCPPPETQTGVARLHHILKAVCDPPELRNVVTFRRILADRVESTIAGYSDKMKRQEARMMRMKTELAAAEKRVGQLMNAQSCVDAKLIALLEQSQSRQLGSQNRTDEIMDMLFSQGSVSLADPLESFIASPIVRKTPLSTDRSNFS